MGYRLSKREAQRKKKDLIDNTVNLKGTKENTRSRIESGFHKKIGAGSWERRAVFTLLRKKLHRKTAAILVTRELEQTNSNEITTIQR